jgi:Concanavalin A-like lectin/glucanases superfamily/F5/8 type C domain
MKQLFTLLLSFITLTTTAQIPSGAALWLKADAGVTINGTTVSAWADQSGNGYNVSQATVANQPIFQASDFNGQPAISFDGSTDFLNNTVNNVVTPGAGRTVFIVSKAACNSVALNYITFRRSTLLCSYQSGSPNFIYSDGVNAGNNASAPANWFDTIKAKPTILSFYNSGIAPNKLNLRMNQQAIVVSQSGGVASESGTAGFSIGRREDGAYFGNGAIAEIIVYNSELNATDRTTVENYLATKYGINNPLPVAAISTNKPTTASSTYFANPQTLGVDDNACTSWSSGTNNGIYTIDLLTPQTIEKILLAMSQTPTGIFGVGCKIEVSVNGTTWITAVDLSGLPNPATQAVNHKFNLQNPIPNIRYIRGNFPSNSSSWIAVAELSVNPDLINSPIKDLTPVILNSNGSFNDGTFLTDSTYYCSKAATYQWKRNGINISGAINQSYTITQPGNYTVTVTYNCSSTCNSALTTANSFSGLPPNAIPTCGLSSSAATTIGVTVPNNAILNPSTAFTYEAWIKAGADVSISRYILVKGSGTYDYTTQMYIQAGTGKIFAATNLGSAGTSTNYKSLLSTMALNDNLWHHIAFTYTGTNLNLFVDGNLDVSTAATGSVLATTQSLFIATTGSSLPYLGSIDEVRFWNTAKTQTEIQEKLDEVLIGNENDLQAYYNFNNNNYNGQNRLVTNQCTNTGSVLNGTTLGNSTQPIFSCAAAAFAEPECTINLISGNNISFPHNASLAVTEFTVAAYVKTNQATATTKRIVYKEGASGGQNYSLNITSTGKVEIQFNNTNFAISTTNVNDNLWHYVVGTYDGSSLKIYVDGTQAGALATANTPSTSVSNNLFIGQNGAGGEQYIGKLDQISIWNTALTQAQIQSNIGYNLSGNETNLVAYYNFNDNTINGTAQTVVNKCTATGVALNGTTSGTPTTPSFGCAIIPILGSPCGLQLNGKGGGVFSSAYTAINTTNNFTIEFILKPELATSEAQPIVTNTGRLTKGNRVILAAPDIYAFGNTSGLNLMVGSNGVELWEQNGYYNHQGRCGFTQPLVGWHHVAVSCTNGALRLYVDGKFVSSAVATGASYKILPILGQYFAGTIAEARFWNRVLSGDEINTNVNTNYIGNETGLQSLYKFDSYNLNGANRIVTGIGPMGVTDNLKTIGDSRTPIFTCANYTGNNTDEAVTVSRPGSGNSYRNYTYGKAAINNWGVMPNLGTITFWFNPTNLAATPQGILTTAGLNANDGGNKGIRFELLQNGNIDVIFGDANSTTNATTTRYTMNIGGVTIQPNKWHHVALVWNKTSNIIATYLNGILSNSNVSVTQWPADFNDVYIGVGFSNSNPFSGAIDEVCFYNTALFESEIKERLVRKISTSDPLYNNLLHYYRFDEVPTSGSYGAGSAVVYDYKGAIHGTLYGINDISISSAPLGDVSGYQYAGNASTANVSFGTGGADVLTTTMSAGNADGIHVYGVNELPNSVTNINAPIAGNNRYGGVFVVNGDAASRYTAKYYYTNNPIVTAGNEPNLKLFKRNNNGFDASNSNTFWYQADNLSLNQTDNYLECTGQFTEYILGVNMAALGFAQLNFTAEKQFASVLLKWDTYDEINMENFILEKSIDGINYLAIDNQHAKNTSRNFYTFIDVATNKGISYYRVKSLENTGKVDYSKILKISFNGKEKYISVYNNPSSNPTIKIESASAKFAELYDIIGNKIESYHTIAGQIISLNKKINSGTYILVLKDNLNTTLTTQKITILK